MQELIAFIGDMGFPIFISLVLIYRLENKLDTLNQTIAELPERIRMT